MPNIIRIIFLLLISLSSYGQMTDAALSAQLSNLVPNNTSKLITPANVRKVIQDGYNSKISLYGSSNILGKLTYGSLYPISGDGDLTHKKYVDDKFASVDLSSKENSLGNPSTNGYILSSTTAGVRSWIPAATGSGTVTSVSSGSLSPLFSVSVGTNTTTPAFSFTPISQAANKHYSGPPSGIDAAPTFRALVEADIPSLDASKITTGTFGDARISSASTWNDKLSTTGGAADQIGYYSSAGVLTSNSKLRLTGGSTDTKLWTSGSSSATIQASTDNASGNAAISCFSEFGFLKFTSYGSTATGSAFTGFPYANSQVIETTGDLAIVPAVPSGKLVLFNNAAIVTTTGFQSKVAVTVDNLNGSATHPVFATSTGQLTNSTRYPRTVQSYVTSSNLNGPYGAYFMPAGTLSQNGDAVICTYSGEKVSGGTGGAVGFFIGGNSTVAQINYTGSAERNLTLQVMVVRISDTQVSVAPIRSDAAIAGANYTVPSLTSNTTEINFNVAGDGAAINSRFSKINFEPAP